jgi:isochorismate synthase
MNDDRDGFALVPFSVTQGPELWINPLIRWQGSEPDAEALSAVEERLDLAGFDRSALTMSGLDLLNDFVDYPNDITQKPNLTDCQHSLEFCQFVRKIIDLLQNQNQPETSNPKSCQPSLRQPSLQKVVWSRTIRFKLNAHAHPCRFFEALCKTYPTLHIVLVQHPAYGIWAGCSPETLVDKKAQKIRSMALAGTRTPGTDAWGQKEIREQKMVLDYLGKQFASNATLVAAEQTSTIQTGPVEHLINQVEGKSSLSCYEMAHILHPTPAVAGFPIAESVEYILKNEPQRRLLYSGYWGYINPEGDGLLSVNLRCLHWEQGHVTLYMGAGILAESDADAEWLETCQKAETLINVLRTLNWISPPEEIRQDRGRIIR